MIEANLPLDQLSAFVNSKAVREFAKGMRKGIVHIAISKPFSPRTPAQSRHINGHVSTIARETGETRQHVKDEIKHRALDMGYPILYIDGVEQKDTYGRTAGISERDASAEEASMLIEAAHILAAELGIVLEEI